MRNLHGGQGCDLLLDSPSQGLSGPLPGEAPAIHAYDLKERKDTVLLDGRRPLRALRSTARSCSTGAEGRTAAKAATSYGIIDAKCPTGRRELRPRKARSHKVGEGALKLDGMRS